MARIVLNLFGSLGDLHPYLALGHGLRERGHQVRIATSEVYRAKVEGDGFRFAAVRPDAGEILDRPELMDRLLDARRGTEFLLREYLIPRVREAFEDLLPVCEPADLLVTHVAGYAGPVVAERLGMRWVSAALQPSAMFSRFDLTTLPRARWLRHLYRLGPWFTGALLAIADRETRRWARPILTLRKELGLRTKCNPVMSGQFSPYGTLALFSRAFAAAQADWPAKTAQTGFVFYDALGAGMPGGATQREELRRFEDFMAAASGPAVLFTLGSSAVMRPGDFFEESARAAEMLGIRAILLAGKTGQTSFPASEDVFVTGYLPYSAVMPRVAAVVHTGGIGSTAQVLRAGVPSLVVPWSNDQPDNADRLRRLGAGRVLPRARYRARAVASELEKVLGNNAMGVRCRGLADRVRGERGVEAACDFLEQVLRGKGQWSGE